MREQQKLIILFDGQCMLCNRFIRVPLNYSKKKFIFISSHSNIGEKICISFDIPTNPQEKPGGYVSQQCFTETIKCGLKCVAAKKGSDCTKASECAACMNCGCTPIENPYTK